MAVKCRVLESGICSITQPYHINGQKGYSYDHWGIDITDFNGTYNVLGWEVAHSDGVVVEMRNNCTGFEYNSYGNYVKLRHPNGMFTLYAHMYYGTVQVVVGQSVKKGQRLGYMGNTGTSYGGHLHWEVRRADDYKIDPEPYLNAELPDANVVTYRSYDIPRTVWLPPVANGKTVNDTAGLPREYMGAIAIKVSKGSVLYSAHNLNGKWLGEITGYNINDYNRGFAGAYKPIDAIGIYSSGLKLAYRVKLLDTQKWQPWVYSANYNRNDPSNGYAGVFGRPIDEIQIKII